MPKKTLTPRFVKQFQCIANACPDTCCQTHWEINIDKKSYQFYQKNKLKKHLLLIKLNDDKWGRVKSNQQNCCSFLTKDKLCRIHKKFGHEALSDVCRNYPRYQYQDNNNLYHSLNLTCPEATRLLLSDKQAMEIHEEVAQVLTEEIPPTYAETLIADLNTYCIRLWLRQPEYPEVALYAIAILLDGIPQHPGNTSPILLLEKVQALEEKLSSGQLTTELSLVPENPLLQWQLLSCISASLQNKPDCRGFASLAPYLQALTKLLCQQQGDELIGMHHLLYVMSNTLRLYIQNNPHLYGNYIHYRLYNDSLPLQKNFHLSQGYRLLVVDFFFIKALLAARLYEQGTLKFEDWVQVIYSFHSLVKNSRLSKEAIVKIIDSTMEETTLSTLQLLC